MENLIRDNERGRIELQNVQECPSAALRINCAPKA
jgi:hypothetical protein